MQLGIISSGGTNFKIIVSKRLKLKKKYFIFITFFHIFITFFEFFYGFSWLLLTFQKDADSKTRAEILIRPSCFALGRPFGPPGRFSSGGSKIKNGPPRSLCVAFGCAGGVARTVFFLARQGVLLAFFCTPRRKT